MKHHIYFNVRPDVIRSVIKGVYERFLSNGVHCSHSSSCAATVREYVLSICNYLEELVPYSCGDRRLFLQEHILFGRRYADSLLSEGCGVMLFNIAEFLDELYEELYECDSFYCLLFLLALS